ncbi:glycosyltransferase [Chromatiaceae bacterium AAb-1]|nr:glycosyltransferase [Chromatiaceae bacterium AAb-1]
MSKRSLKLLFYINVLIVLFLVGYHAYLLFFRPEFAALHTSELDKLEQRLQGKDHFSFAVVGNINNSVGIFENKIIPMLNSSGVDFVVSAGNAVSGGGEDKYRALYGTLSKLKIPYLLTFGQNEAVNFGDFRFYEHFGPYFYAVDLPGSRLIFLDSTGKTPYQWQIRWLQSILAARDVKHTILFIGHPLWPVEQDIWFEQEDDYLQSTVFREQLLKLIDTFGVGLVFSANLPLYSEQQHQNSRYIVTGGAGGLIFNDEISFYHYVRVTVTPEQVFTNLELLEIGQHPLFKQLESFWFFIYSLFYVGWLNFILLLSTLIVVAIWLYTRIFTERDYYPDYTIDATPWLNQPLNIVMFTNNYLPFIGGVPLSVERLRQGLKALGNQVLVVAPSYRQQGADDDNIIRVPSLLAWGEKQEFRLANIFKPGLSRRIKAWQPDIIHLHHPFWLGTVGLLLAKRLRLPVIYTYHTRLEHYAHFVPLPSALFRNLISHSMIKRFANKCDALIVPTDSAAEYLRMIGVKTAVYVQPTGIDYEQFSMVSEQQVKALAAELALQDEFILISVSRLSDEKNIDFMIEAVAELRNKISCQFKLLLIGDGHQRVRLQQKITALGLQQHMVLTGAVPPEKMPLYYRLGKAFVFTSKSETQGMVILEAMAAGLPVVAIRSSGIDDVIREDYNGYKTPENTALWNQKIITLMNDEHLRQTMATQAQQFAADYSVSHFARNVRTIYAQVLAVAARRKP